MTEPTTLVGAEQFRAAMGRLASGVVVVTTCEETGVPHGITATSFCSVSLHPPLVLVCVGETASAFEVFAACSGFAVSVLREDHAEVATRFATSGAEKFPAGETLRTPGDLPVVRGALSRLECGIHERFRLGDHLVLVGEVRDVELAEGGPLVYFDRGFRGLCS